MKKIIHNHDEDTKIPSKNVFLLHFLHIISKKYYEVYA